MDWLAAGVPIVILLAALAIAGQYLQSMRLGGIKRLARIGRLCVAMVIRMGWRFVLFVITTVFQRRPRRIHRLPSKTPMHPLR